MDQEILNIIITGVSIIFTGLCSWAVTALVNFLNAKIQDKKLATFLTKMTIIVTDAVQSIYQEYVSVLKENGKFDDAAQQEAKARAINIIENQLTVEMQQYIIDNFGEMEAWISEKIESVIYQLKNQ